jgi:regulator of nucleoside diphosphate kinase
VTTQKNQLLISDKDMRALYALLNTRRAEGLNPLEEELSKATVVPEEKMPPDVVSIQSMVRVKDLDSGQETEFQLVFPHEAKVEEKKVSILVPMGMAVIGLRAGQTYEWPMPGGKTKHFRVISSHRLA